MICSTQALEAQLAESDAEAQRLRVTFEELKRSTSETIAAAEKKIVELEKESGTKASVYASDDAILD
jgi:hypothetical protein